MVEGMTREQARDLVYLAEDFDALVRRCGDFGNSGDETVDQALHAIAVAMAQCERGLLLSAQRVLERGDEK